MIKVILNGSEESGHLIMKLLSIKKQKGSRACGGYAIAFALHVAIAMGNDITG